LFVLTLVGVTPMAGVVPAQSACVSTVMFEVRPPEKTTAEIARSELVIAARSHRRPASVSKAMSAFQV
jgi:hypothetical protein